MSDVDSISLEVFRQLQKRSLNKETRNLPKLLSIPSLDILNQYLGQITNCNGVHAVLCVGA